MAAGDQLLSWEASGGHGPTTRFATFDTFVDGSTPTMEVFVADFDPGATTEFLDFVGKVPQQYNGSDALEVVIDWTSEATSGNAKWDVFIKSITPGVDSLATKAFAAAQSTTTAASGTARVPASTVIDFTNAQADGLQPGDIVVVRVERDSVDGADTINSNDTELVTVELRINV